MNDIEFFGRVAQKPAKVNEDSHPFYTGRWNRTPDQPKQKAEPKKTTYERFPIEDQ